MSGRPLTTVRTRPIGRNRLTGPRTPADSDRPNRLRRSAHRRSASPMSPTPLRAPRHRRSSQKLPNLRQHTQSRRLRTPRVCANHSGLSGSLSNRAMYTVTNYRIHKGGVTYVLSSGARGSVDITEVDWRKTSHLNAEPIASSVATRAAITEDPEPLSARH